MLLLIAIFSSQLSIGLQRFPLNIFSAKFLQLFTCFYCPLSSTYRQSPSPHFFKTCFMDILTQLEYQCYTPLNNINLCEATVKQRSYCIVCKLAESYGGFPKGDTCKGIQWSLFQRTQHNHKHFKALYVLNC